MSADPHDHLDLSGAAHEAEAAASFSMQPALNSGSLLKNTKAAKAAKKSRIGKETVIGLSTVGILGVVFTGLLFNRLTRQKDDDNQQQVALDATAALAQPTRTNVVAAERDNGVPAGGQNQRERRDGRTGADADGAPRASYMPAAEAPRDRYAERAAQIEEEAASTAAPARKGNNPFFRGGNDTAAGTAAEDDIPDAEPRTIDAAPAGAQALSDRSRRRNPFPARPVNAEEPADDLPGQDLPAGQLPSDDLGQTDPPADESPAETAPTELPQEAPAENPVEEQPSGEVETPTISVPARGADRYGNPRDADPPAEMPAETPAARSPAAIAPETTRGADASGADGRYTVGPNDTLWSISEKVYGTGGYFKAIYEHNKSLLPHADRLTVGTVISVPPAATLAENYPTLCPKQRRSALVKAKAPRSATTTAAPRRGGSNIYLVQEGDTLFDIARYELGKASRWGEIYELNRDLLGEDFDYLKPGIELQLPGKARGGEAISSRPGDDTTR